MTITSLTLLLNYVLKNVVLSGGDKLAVFLFLEVTFKKMLMELILNFLGKKCEVKNNGIGPLSCI